MLKRIIRENKIDIVISDNRFGLWNRNIKTVYVTHMPLIPFPKLFKSFEFIGILLHRVIIKKYSLCFIPDLPGEINLSGRLSHGIKLPDNVRFTGILSRFMTKENISEESTPKFSHNTVILSGPEPQKGILKNKLTAILKDQLPVTVILEGKPLNKGETAGSGNIIFYNHLPAAEMKVMITGSETIIARSGYTTIMELISLNCRAILIPTPGQTEQEYLAEYLSERGWFTFIRQSELKEIIPDAPLESIKTCEILESSSILLSEALKELLEDPQVKA